MAKRFTDTDKWKKKFIRGLDAPYKVLWFYILDDCNHAGIWDVDMDVANIRMGCSLNEKTAIEKFGNKIKVFDNGEKWFIPDFIDFQYGVLNPKNRVHESVLALLKKYKIKGLTRGLLDPKDKDKEKDKDNTKKRRELFQNEISEFTDYSKKILSDFFDYWSEVNKSNTKMRFELEKTWDLNLRLKRWNKNDFNKSKDNNPEYELI